MANTNPFDYEAIRNTLSNYCIALDSKDFSLLTSVFTSDVDAQYPFAHHTSCESIAAAIQKRLQHITSQHALTTQIINISGNGKTASATTYFTGIHFGQGKWKGQQVTAWGKYVDSLVLTEGEEKGAPGASGKWLVSKRVVEFMGRLGEEGVMKGEDD